MNILKSGIQDGYVDALFDFKPLMIKKSDLKDEIKRQGLVATNDRWLTKSVVPFYGLTLVAVVIVYVVLNWETVKGWL